MRNSVAVLGGLLVGIACAGAPERAGEVEGHAVAEEPQAAPAGEPKPAPAAGEPIGKPGAPVEVSGTLGAGRARIEIAFAADAREVRVELRGTNGLVVEGAPVPVQGRSVARGETIALDVSFVPGEAHSNLGVLVSGRFAGGLRSRAASFTVGGQPERPAHTRARDDGSGRPIKVAGEGEIRE